MEEQGPDQQQRRDLHVSSHECRGNQGWADDPEDFYGIDVNERKIELFDYLDSIDETLKYDIDHRGDSLLHGALRDPYFLRHLLENVGMDASVQSFDGLNIMGVAANDDMINVDAMEYLDKFCPCLRLRPLKQKAQTTLGILPLISAI